MTTYEPGATTLTRTGEIWTLTLTGEHDLTTVESLDDDMEQIAASGTSVVINLSPATFIDSQVIAWLLRWWKRSLESTHLHVAVAVGEAPSPVTRLLDLVDLADTLPCYPTTTAALRQLQAGTTHTSTPTGGDARDDNRP
jgi:anti-anti-sigma factor